MPPKFRGLCPPATREEQMFYDRIPDWSPEDLAPFIENEETGEENRKLDAEIAQLEGEHAKLDAKYGQYDLRDSRKRCADLERIICGNDPRATLNLQSLTLLAGEKGLSAMASEANTMSNKLEAKTAALEKELDAVKKKLEITEQRNANAAMLDQLKPSVDKLGDADQLNRYIADSNGLRQMLLDKRLEMKDVSYLFIKILLPMMTEIDGILALGDQIRDFASLRVMFNNFSAQDFCNELQQLRKYQDDVEAKNGLRGHHDRYRRHFTRIAEGVIAHARRREAEMEGACAGATDRAQESLENDEMEVLTEYILKILQKEEGLQGICAGYASRLKKCESQLARSTKALRESTRNEAWWKEGTRALVKK